MKQKDLHQFSPSDWFNLSLIVRDIVREEMFELEDSKELDPLVYAKIKVCIEFLSYLRGEFFHSSRPLDTKMQRDLEYLEASLKPHLAELSKKVDLADKYSNDVIDLYSEVLFYGKLKREQKKTL